MIHEREQLRTYECDGLMNYRVIPDLVVLPETAEHVQKIVRTCYEEGIPFVARGSGTGLSGGALPVEAGRPHRPVSRMRKILEVDIPNQRIVVEPGVINIWVSQEVADEGYYYAPDPASQIVSSIGGNLAENSRRRPLPEVRLHHQPRHGRRGRPARRLGGAHRRRQGADAPGYELLGAVRRLRGDAGIATKITLRLVRKPESVRTLLAAFKDTEEAGGAVSGIIGARHRARRHRDDGRA